MKGMGATKRYRIQTDDGEVVASCFSREEAEEQMKFWLSWGYSSLTIVEVTGTDNRW